VTEPVVAFAVLAGLRRDYSRRTQTFRQTGITTGVQWGTDDLRFQVYWKGVELHEGALRDRDPERKALLRSLSSNAEKVIRLEVTCRTAKAVRDLFGLSGPDLPRFSRVLQPDVAQYALGREFRRLGLLRVSKLSTAKVSRTRALGMDFLAARDRVREAGQTVGRHLSGVSASRLALLYAYYTLSGSFSDREFLSRWGFSRAALSELRSDLAQLGIPTSTRQTPDARRVLAEIATQLRPLVSLRRPVLARGDLALAPWAPVDAVVDPVSRDDFSHLLERVDDSDFCEDDDSGPEADGSS
jgi:hypothetical protein